MFHLTCPTNVTLGHVESNHSTRGRLFVFLPHHIAAGQSHRGITQRGRGTGKRDTHINGYNVRNKMEEMTRVTAEHCNLQLF